jgi:SAM-dependent methyltransferase
VLEVGAGGGELAAELRASGYDVLAIDPAGGGEGVRQIALEAIDEPDASFQGALAVLSLHHVTPLEASCERLAAAVVRGGVLVIDEFDVASFDERTAQWWLDQAPATEHEHPSASVLVSELRHHLHPLSLLVETLSPWFEFAGAPQRGPYLYRWKLGPELRRVEERLLAEGRLSATGARLVGTRR